MLEADGHTSAANLYRQVASRFLELSVITPAAITRAIELDQQMFEEIVEQEFLLGPVSP